MGESGTTLDVLDVHQRNPGSFSGANSINTTENIAALRRSRAGYAANVTKLRRSIEGELGELEHDEAEYKIQEVYSAYEQFLAANNKLLEAVKMTNNDEEFTKSEELSNRLGQEMKEFNKRVYRWRLLSEDIGLGESAASTTSNSSRRSSLLARSDQTKKELRLKQLREREEQLRERETLLNERHRAEQELEEAKLTSALEELALEEANLNRNTKLQDKASVGWEATPIHTGHDDFKCSTRVKNKAHIKWEPRMYMEPSPIHAPYASQQKRSQPLPRSHGEGTVNSLNPFLVGMDQKSPHQSLFSKLAETRTVRTPFQTRVYTNPFLETNIRREEPRNDDTAVAYNSMAAAVREAFSMPKPEIQVFRGDPTEYYKFICCFENNIAKRAPDDGARLGYLIQFCEGEAKECISDFVIQHPSEGYRNAREALKSRYGRPHTIVQTYIKQLADGAPIKPNDPKALSSLAMLMAKCSLTLQEMGYDADLNNSTNLLKIVRRLPISIRRKWADKASSLIDTDHEPTFADLMRFVQQQAKVANTMYGLDLVQQPEKATPSISSRPPTSQRHVSTFATTNEYPESEPVLKCLKCDKDHVLEECPSFNGMSYPDRKAFSRMKGLCDNCFKRGHRSSNCLQEKLCSLRFCDVPWKHSILLHPPEENRTSQQTHVTQHDTSYCPDEEDQTTDECRSAYRSYATTCATEAGKRILLRIVPVQVRGPHGGPCVSTYALLDDCSDVSLCDERLSKALGLKGKRREFHLTTVNKQASKSVGYEVKCNVTSVDGLETVELDKVLTVKKIPISKKNIVTQADLNVWSHLQDITLPTIDTETCDVQLLIGSDVPKVFWNLEERRGGRKDPYAVKSVLGWTVIGPLLKKGEEKRNSDNDDGEGGKKDVALGSDDDVLGLDDEKNVCGKVPDGNVPDCRDINDATDELPDHEHNDDNEHDYVKGNDNELERKEENDSTQIVAELKTTNDLNETRDSGEFCIEDNYQIHEFKDNMIKNNGHDLNCKESTLEIDEFKDSVNDDDFKGTEDDASYNDQSSRSIVIKIETTAKQNLKLSADSNEMEDNDNEYDNEVVRNDDDITNSEDKGKPKTH